ncbi:MAG TPA: hypothetical protein VLZ44_09455 [Treponemataceae bacterium]|jgi:hypothetical protein|nr:hypothetical protein [Treponemataceae bacterium]
MTVYIALFTILNVSLWILLFVRLKKEFSPAAVLREIRQEVEKLIIEINKEVDQDISLIEARRSGLKELLEKIDERILTIDKKIGLIDSQNALLREEEKILEKLSPQRAYLKNKTKNQKADMPLFSQSKEKNTTESIFSLNQEEPERFLQGRVEKEKQEEPIRVSFSKNPINQGKAMKDLVISMALQGKDESEIADALKMPVREVAFIIELHGN